MTTTGVSLQSKIDKVEDKIDALDDEYTNTEEVNNKLGEIKIDMEALAEEGVLETDYNQELLKKYKKLYADADDFIVKAKVDAWQGRAGALAETYVYTMRADVESINDEYDALIKSGIPVKVDYTTGDAETFYVFTTKNTSADRLSTLVKILPKKASGTYTQAVIDTDNNKVLKSIEFVRTSGTVYSGGTNDEYIFAITGVQADRTLANGNTEQAISMKNYSGADKNANVIITGYIDGEFTAVMIPATIKNKQYSGVLNVEIPEKAERMTNRAMFIWDSDPKTMKAFSRKLPIK